MIQIKEFFTSGTPSYDELIEAHKIARYDNCLVHLKWFIEYNGWNDRYISKDTDIEKMNEQLRNIVYPI